MSSSAEPPIFSLVVPAYNAAGTLRRAVRSIIEQDLPVEIVVVDDGSTDNTADVIGEIGTETALPIVHRKILNSGPSAARNLGVLLSSGAYIVFLDADDCLLPDALKVFESAIKHYGYPDAIYGGFELQEENRPVRCYRAPPTRGNAAADFRAFLTTRPRPLTPGNVCVNRQVFDRLRFPEHLRIAEDLVFFGHLMATSRVASVPQPVLRRFGIAQRGTDRAVLRVEELVRSVDALFDPGILPPEAMALRRSQLGMTYLSLFRVFHAAGRQQLARRYFWKGLALVPGRATQPRYLRKLVRSYMN